MDLIPQDFTKDTSNYDCDEDDVQDSIQVNQEQPLLIIVPPKISDDDIDKTVYAEENIPITNCKANTSTIQVTTDDNEVETVENQNNKTSKSNEQCSTSNSRKRRIMSTYEEEIFKIQKQAMLEEICLKKALHELKLKHETEMHKLKIENEKRLHDLEVAIKLKQTVLLDLQIDKLK